MLDIKFFGFVVQFYGVYVIIYSTHRVLLKVLMWYRGDMEEVEETWKSRWPTPQAGRTSQHFVLAKRAGRTSI
ncbi:hypothetical protein Sjap_011111 [Stephania japonica]|uniref:Uncharacterized protein n=1 Tax=Stephania japonica TaxID=461633 RepID=A0AAP0JAY7_9MAGN